MAHRKRKRTQGARFKILNQGPTKSRENAPSYDEVHSSAITQQEGRNHTNKAAKDIPRALRNLRCENCQSKGTIVLVFNAEGGVAYCTKCRSLNSQRKVQEAEEEIRGPAKSSTHDMTTGKATPPTRTGKETTSTIIPSSTSSGKSGQLKEGIDRLQNLEARMERREEEDEAKWKEQVETNEDYWSRIGTLEDENAATKDDIKQIHEEAEGTAASINLVRGRSSK